MRTTLSIDDDVLAAAKRLARRERKSVGEVISALARASLWPSKVQASRNSVPLLPPRGGASPVTPERVKDLRDMPNATTRAAMQESRARVSKRTGRTSDAKR